MCSPSSSCWARLIMREVLIRGSIARRVSEAPVQNAEQVLASAAVAQCKEAALQQFREHGRTYRQLIRCDAVFVLPDERGTLFHQLVAMPVHKFGDEHFLFSSHAPVLPSRIPERGGAKMTVNDMAPSARVRNAGRRRKC